MDYNFTANVMQRRITYHRGCQLAGQIIDGLKDNPVLIEPVIAISPFDEALNFNLTNRIPCNGQDKLAVILALNACIEQWSDTLAEAGLEHELHTSHLAAR